MIRILFVDDDRALLNALGNVLRKERHRWSLAFAESGEKALAALAAQRHDVVVSDMRMPGMDGASLLTEVKKHYPDIVRIILSGHADRQSLVRAAPVAHQILAKPCEGPVLVNALERAGAHALLMTSESLRAVAGRLEGILRPPQLYWDVPVASEGTGRAIAATAATIEADQRLAAKVLEIANTIPLLPARPLSSLTDALVQLHPEPVRSLLLLAHLLLTLEPHIQVPGFSVGDVIAHSVHTATTAQRLLRDPEAAAMAFTAGLLHETGVLIAAAAVPQQLTEELTSVRQGGGDEGSLPADLAGSRIEQLGAYVLAQWGLPSRVVEAVIHHEDPWQVPHKSMDVLSAVYLADIIAAQTVPRDRRWTRVRAVNDQYLDAIGAPCPVELRRRVS